MTKYGVVTNTERRGVERSVKEAQLCLHLKGWGTAHPIFGTSLPMPTWFDPE